VTKSKAADVFKSLLPEISTAQLDSLLLMKEVYMDLNDKINVISRKDIELILERHVLHSLFIAKHIRFKAGANILDVGTGGGFPGIPLAILNPDSNFHLIDSIGKKITVVNDAAKALGLKNVTAEQKRAEKVKAKYDFVTCRAVTRLNNFMPWVRHNISPVHNHPIKNGILALKGGDLDEEINEIREKVTQFDLSKWSDNEFFSTKKLLHIPIEKK
jgi:16S rRNA (guanine527-N7)-methyltransferase